MDLCFRATEMRSYHLFCDGGRLQCVPFPLISCICKPRDSEVTTRQPSADNFIQLKLSPSPASYRAQALGQPHKNMFRLSQIPDFSAESTSCPSKKTDKPESPGSANHHSVRTSLSFEPLTKQTPDYNVRFLAVAEGTDPPWQQQHLCMIRT